MQVVFANPAFTNLSSDEIRFEKLWQSFADPLFDSGFIETNQYELFRRHATVLKLRPKDGSNITRFLNHDWMDIGQLHSLTNSMFLRHTCSHYYKRFNDL